MAPKIIRGKRGKTTAKTTVARIPQPHGGALNAHGTPGNGGGTGRPPSAIRDRFREALDKRLPVLEDVADGQVIQRIEVPLFAVLEHAGCPKCGSGLKPNEVSDLLTVTVVGRVSASPRDRILAIKGMADVGMTANHLDLQEVRHRLRETLAVIRTELSGKDAERVIGRLKPVWAA